MSVRIFKDIEEALAREVRRLTYHDQVTATDTVLQDAFDPFTGEIVSIPVEPQFYDSSADTQSIDYPNIFIKLLRTREDRFSGRVTPQYGRDILVPVASAPKAYEIVANGVSQNITPGNDLITSLFKIIKVQPGHLLRILNGTNQGTYTVASITLDSGGSHTISVSNVLLANLPEVFFDPITRDVIFQEDTDLNTIKAGDVFTDNSSNSFNVVSADPINNRIVIDGSTTPDTSSEGNLARTGDVFISDPDLVRYLVLDPTKPIQVQTPGGLCDATSEFSGTSPSIPLDMFYLIRIDSKERQTHIEILNRMWEEFNPPRTGLPVVVRSSKSADTLLTEDVPTGGSQTITVKDNSKINIGDPVVLFDELSPSKDTSSEGFEGLFSTHVTGKVGTDQLQLQDVIPETFTVNNTTRVVTHTTMQILMFHFIDHKTRDVESAQYWVHEFTFWVQATIDRLGDAEKTTVVTDIDAEIEIGVDC